MDQALKEEWNGWLDKVHAAGIEREAVEDTMVYKLGSLDGFEAQLDTVFGPREAQPAVIRIDNEAVAANLTLAGAKRFKTDRADLFSLPKFLSVQECRDLIDLIKARLRRSTVLGETADKAFRTSSSCDLNHLAHPLRKAIDERISALLGVDNRLSEKIQGQHYEVGQEFKPHMDYFHGDQIIQESHGMGQRSWTVMVYLNSTKAGGDTVFTELPTRFRPKPGLAVIWNNRCPDGTGNPDTMHHATPVKAGSKTIITKWFRSYVRI